MHRYLSGLGDRHCDKTFGTLLWSQFKYKVSQWESSLSTDEQMDTEAIYTAHADQQLQEARDGDANDHRDIDDDPDNENAGDVVIDIEPST